MNRHPHRIYSLFLLIFLVFGCERRICGCVFPETPLAGEWVLDQVTYGLSQKTVMATELGYTQAVSFTGYASEGSYKELRNSIPVRSGTFSAAFPNGGSTKGILYYPADTTQQLFEIKGNQLYLSERGPRGVTVADGSTYRYQR